MLNIRYPFFVVALFISAPLYAGALIPVIVQSTDDAFDFASPSVGVPVTTTITLTFNANNTSAEAAVLNTLAIQGTNASDYAISGGTCIAGSTNLNSGNQTCTVIVRYTPSSTAAETAQLAINCSTVGIAGGFSLICSPATGTISLLGSALAAIAANPAPALSPRWLTLLSTMFLGIGVYFAGRRNG